MRTETAANRWLAGESGEPSLVVVGVPNSKASGSGADLAPLDVRDRLTQFSTYHADLGVDLSDLAVQDIGNWPVTTIDPVPLIGDLVSRSTDLPEAFRIYLGGDNAITRPLVNAASENLGRVGLICFDSEYGADDLNSGPNARNPIRGLIEDGLPGQNIVQIGIHPLANDAAGREFVEDSGVTTVTVDQVSEIGVRAAVDVALNQLKTTCHTIYVDVDLGVLDRTAAPGALSARPGGLTVRELAIGVARCAAHPVVNALDLVGVDPAQDRNGASVDVMAYLLLTAAAGRAKSLNPR